MIGERVGWGALIVLFLCAFRTDLTAQNQDTKSHIREVVSAQFTAEIAVTGRTATVSPTRIYVEPLEARRGFTVWSAMLAADHGSRLLVVVDSTGVLYRLGGFSLPDLVGMNRLLGFVADTSQLRERARELSVLADLNGGEEVYVPGGEELRPRLEQEWSASRPRDWPEDAVVVTSNGSALVTTTALSHSVRSLTLEWTPISYAFVFDAAGELLAWSRRVGGRLPNTPEH